MFLIRYALRRPFTVLVAVAALCICGAFAYQRQKVDIFPSLNLPVIYVCQPYGGMDPAQMEGLLTNYYEYHFLYINGIHHVESKNVQGTALMKLVFHPGTNMPQAMAETIAYVNRSRAFMPPGTVNPFVMRFDTGSVPVGYLVLSSEKRTLTDIQQLALNDIRPMFASVPGVSAPPPFGGSQRTVCVRVDPNKLRARGISPEEVAAALAKNHTISPSGNIREGDRYPIVRLNSIIAQPADMGRVPVRTTEQGTVFVRDLAVIEDAADMQTGYALFNGKKSVYIVVTKRAEASTVDVINNVRKALPTMQAKLTPNDINVSLELDQSVYVNRSIRSLETEAALGALLTGLMVLVFLRDWRSALVVVLNIPLALLASYVALWLTGQTINLMTLGGLALAVGILVDEATVEIENIHSQMRRTGSIARAVREGNAVTAVPRLMAMLSILAVFVPTFFMQGAAQALFAPLALAVGFAMIASYILSSTFVPVFSVWLLRRHGSGHDAAPDREHDHSAAKAHPWYRGLLSGVVAVRWLVIPAYLAASLAGIWIVGNMLGIEIFPQTNAGQFRLRLRAPDGTHFEATTELALSVLKDIEKEVGPGKIETTLGYVGTIPSTYPINALYQWSRGPEEALLLVAFKPGSGVAIDALQESLRTRLPEKYQGLRLSFEPSDIVNEVMSFGSPTPIDVSISGTDFAANRAFAEKLAAEFKKLPALRDVQFAQSLDYPTIDVTVDRERAGMRDVVVEGAAKSIVAATGSTRFTVPMYWPDPKSGVGFQVQVEIPQPQTTSMSDLGAVPLQTVDGRSLLLRDVATLTPGTMPGQYDRYNMKRQIGVTANIYGEDLYHVGRDVQGIIDRLKPEMPAGALLEVRGQIPPLNDMLSGLGVGLIVAVAAIFLLLTANFQSVRLAIVALSTVPAVLLGVVVALRLTNTTLNIQSFTGTIMAVGVAMANAILLVTFSERSRREGTVARDAAVVGASGRLRAVLMTSMAMIAGMIPMALGLGESGGQTAPLGLAVVGGLTAATLSTLFILPCFYAVLQAFGKARSASLDPDDPESRHFDHATATT
jgi:multidrug efflux pump subunit AcrB